MPREHAAITLTSDEVVEFISSRRSASWPRSIPTVAVG